MSIAPQAETRSETRERSGFLLRRVRIRNYKSIASCDVELGPFTLLVGRNGAGKSNFLDAIRLVSQGVRSPDGWPQYLLRIDSRPDRSYPWNGRTRWIRRTGPLEPPATEISLELTLSPGEATYEVRLRPWTNSGIEGIVQEFSGVFIERERLVVTSGDGTVAHYEVDEGELVDSTETVPQPEKGRLLLSQIYDNPRFEPVRVALSAMGFYELRPEVMRSRATRHYFPILLTPDGSNFGSVMAHYLLTAPESVGRIGEWLKIIVPECGDIKLSDSAPTVDLIFEYGSSGSGDPRTFSVDGVSDGTLRALGILVAVNQLASDGRPIRLVGIEEPETALHPAAAGALMDALREAATHTQVLVTTHSADLLDLYDPDEDHVLAVEMRGGRTEIGPINRASREAIRERLYSAGELLRMDHLDPERSDVPPQPPVGSTEESDQP